MLAKLNPLDPPNPYRLVLFCTLADRVPYGNSLIEFPTHVEIKCNGAAVSANVRGIKNRPGTVNPPDLTQQAILMHGVNNRVDITYQESKQAYTVLLYLVQKFTVDQLVEKVTKRGYIGKEQTLKRSMSS
jgi:E3 SUMO-protein ligase PIAS1